MPDGPLEGSTALHLAAWRRGLPLASCRVLVRKGLLVVDLENRHGKTALHLAASVGNAPMCQALLENGASALRFCIT
jgi:ankyrin repeat protein